MEAQKLLVRSEMRDCGPGCDGCPHGPYFYGYTRVRGKLYKCYFGRKEPSGAAAERARLQLQKKADDQLAEKLHRKKARKGVKK